MQSIRCRWIVTTLALVFSLAWQARAAEPPAETIAVAKTYNNAPFEYRSRLLADRAEFHVYRLTYPSPVATPLKQNNTIPADYYLPKQLQPGAKYPAVICLHILDGNEPLTEMVCSVLASRGIPAISFKLPYYGSRGGPKGPEALAGDPKMFVGAIRQAGEDIRRTIDLLASRPEVNPERIGITGISLGGIIAASAAGAEPRLYRAGLILSGGDVLAIVHHARETRELSAMIRNLPREQRAAIEGEIAAADPLKFAPALRERARQGRVLMINAAEDEVIPRRCTEKLAEALGIADRVTWLPGVGHYTAVAELPNALRMTADFFAQDLPKGAAPPAALPAAATTPAQRLAALLHNAIVIFSEEPNSSEEPNGLRCHMASLGLSVELPGHARPIEANLNFMRLPDSTFRLDWKLPGADWVMLGQQEFPWLYTGKETVIAGVKFPLKNRDPLQFVDPQNMTKLRVFVGLLRSVVMVPEMLQQWLTVEADKASNAMRSYGQGHEAFSGRGSLDFPERRPHTRRGRVFPGRRPRDN